MFFAVAYDGTRRSDNVRGYFGGPKAPAALDRATSYGAGALSMEAVRTLQAASGTVPDFAAAPPKVTAPIGPAVTPRGGTNPTDAAVSGIDTPVPPARARPRIIATIDGEIDDRCSMVRFLLYANEWDIKGIIYIILDQDKTFRRYIEPNWPGLMVLGSFRQFATIAYSWERKIPRGLHRFYNAAWMRANILTGHGPLCARYEHHPQKGFCSEGDSPAFMHQIPVGLRSLTHLGYGGWGGRFVLEGRSTSTWRGARDDGDLGKPIWRFSGAFQNDWAARADWCVTPIAQANHPPVAKVAGPLDRTVKPGQKVTLSAAGSSDPDGDELSFRWWRYDDVDTATAKIEIADSTAQTGASFVVPDQPGKTIHVVLDVTDDGGPPLTRYQRIIFTIAK